MAKQDFFRTHKYLSTLVVLILAVLTMMALWVLMETFRPLPPRTVTMVTGAEGGAYHAYGLRYREILARAGVDLKLLPTAGSLDSLNRLDAPGAGVSIGFLQGGVANGKTAPDLESLGTIFYEPLWIFCRSSLRVQGLEGLRGRRVSIGPVGSGTRTLVLELLARKGMQAGFAELLPRAFQESSEKLLRGEIDAALVLASWDSPVVQRLLASEDIDLISFPNEDAYIALYPFLHKVMLPAGVIDMARNRLPTDAFLLAPKASLVVRKDVHPAIQYLLLDAAEKIHSDQGLFQKFGEFPEAESTGLPLSEEARRFYRSGQPFLNRYLPFWLAVLIGRLLVLLIPVLGILLPLIRIVPAFIGWKIKRKIYKLYYELRAIEFEWEKRERASGDAAFLSRLEQLEDKADKLWLPVSSMGVLYLFKEHVSLVRKRFEEEQKNFAGEPASH